MDGFFLEGLAAELCSAANLPVPPIVKEGTPCVGWNDWRSVWDVDGLLMRLTNLIQCAGGREAALGPHNPPARVRRRADDRAAAAAILAAGRFLRHLQRRLQRPLAPAARLAAVAGVADAVTGRREREEARSVGAAEPGVDGAQPWGPPWGALSGVLSSIAVKDSHSWGLPPQPTRGEHMKALALGTSNLCLFCSICHWTEGLCGAMVGDLLRSEGLQTLSRDPI